MKKILLAAICVIGFTAVGSAQFFEKDSIFRNKLVEGIGDQDFELHIKLVDEYKKTNASYTWRREIITIEGSWTTAVCDPFVCHGSATDKAPFTSDTTRNDDMIVHFYVPDTSGGKGAVRIIVKNFDTNVEDTAVYSINVWNAALSVETPDKNNISIYPNPSSDFVTISSDQRIETVEVLTLEGKVVKTSVANGVAEIKIDMNDLPNGLYLVKVKNTGGTVKTAKVSKTD